MHAGINCVCIMCGSAHSCGCVVNVGQPFEYLSCGREEVHDTRPSYQQLQLDDKSKTLPSTCIAAFTDIPDCRLELPPLRRGFKSSQCCKLYLIPHVICYMDDILVIDNDYLHNLNTVFEHLQQNRFSLKKHISPGFCLITRSQARHRGTMWFL